MLSYRPDVVTRGLLHVYNHGSISPFAELSGAPHSHVSTVDDTLSVHAQQHLPEHCLAMHATQQHLDQLIMPECKPL